MLAAVAEAAPAFELPDFRGRVLNQPAAFANIQPSHMHEVGSTYTQANTLSQ